MNFEVKLEEFQGPLDLLFKLIEEKKLDITKISLSKITEDYLNYLKYFEEKDPLNLANFLVIAARLILIKSKMLLPFLELTEEEEAEIKDLEDRLLVYAKFKETAKALKEISVGRASFSRELMMGGELIFLPPENISAEILRLAMLHILEEVESLKEKPLERERIKEIISLQDKIEEIKKRLAESLERNFSDFVKTSKKDEVIVFFLAVLELIKQKFINAEQNELFGDIKLCLLEDQ